MSSVYRKNLIHLPAELQELVWEKYTKSFVIPELLARPEMYEQHVYEEAFTRVKSLLAQSILRLYEFAQENTFAYTVGLDVLEDRLLWSDCGDPNVFHMLEYYKRSIEHPSYLQIMIEAEHMTSLESLDKTEQFMHLVHANILPYEPISDSDCDEAQ